MENEEGLLNEDLSLPVVLTDTIHTTETIVPCKKAQSENKKAKVENHLTTEEEEQSGQLLCSAGKPAKTPHNQSSASTSNVKGFM